MTNTLYDHLLANGASSRTLRHFVTLGKSTSNEKLSRKDKKEIRKIAKNQLIASQSITEVTDSTARVYPHAKFLSQVKNGNQFQSNGKVVYMQAISGSTWAYPLALISESKKQDKKKE